MLSTPKLYQFSSCLNLHHMFHLSCFTNHSWSIDYIAFFKSFWAFSSSELSLFKLPVSNLCSVLHSSHFLFFFLLPHISFSLCFPLILFLALRPLNTLQELVGLLPFCGNFHVLHTAIFMNSSSGLQSSVTLCKTQCDWSLLVTARFGMFNCLASTCCLINCALAHSSNGFRIASGRHEA